MCICVCVCVCVCVRACVRAREGKLKRKPNVTNSELISNLRMVCFLDNGTQKLAVKWYLSLATVI
jgi:hypothetical protein